MLVVINPEQRIPPGHPLRRINLGSQVAVFVELARGNDRRVHDRPGPQY